jgi:hypothetical protein
MLLRPEYLSQKLDRPLPTKDGGTLRTIIQGRQARSVQDMNGQPIQDRNDGKPWSEMDLFDLRNSLAFGRSIEEIAGFLCRAGTVEEVKRKAEELGLLR